MVKSINLTKETLQKISKDFKKKGSVKTNKSGTKTEYTYTSNRNFDDVTMMFTEYNDGNGTTKITMEYGTICCAISQTFIYDTLSTLTEKQFIKLVRYNLDLTTELLGIYDLEKGIK
jgi:hypothetical protein